MFLVFTGRASEAESLKDTFRTFLRHIHNSRELEVEGSCFNFQVAFKSPLHSRIPPPGKI